MTAGVEKGDFSPKRKTVVARVFVIRAEPGGKGDAPRRLSVRDFPASRDLVPLNMSQCRS